MHAETPPEAPTEAATQTPGDPGGIDALRTELARVTAERDNLELMLECARLGVWDWDIEAGVLMVNRQWAAIIGRSPDEMAPLEVARWRAMVHPEDLDGADDLLQRHLASESSHFEAEYRVRHHRGGWVWVRDRGRVLEWSQDGAPRRMGGTREDITNRRRADDAMRDIALLDPLTRLGNRRMLDARLDELVMDARVEGLSFGLVMLDIDHFKAINDHLGHLGGDAVLQAVATCIGRSIRGDDVAVRHAGDEFAVLLPTATAEVVGSVADRLVAAIRSAAIPADAEGHALTVSVGAAHSDELDRLDENSLVRLADRRLYAAKDAGRDRAAAAG